jgi:aryl-alcohol dehydrogenase-like predicted oxidoreductase
VVTRHHVSNLCTSCRTKHPQPGSTLQDATAIEMRLLPAGAPRLGLGLAALGRPGYITLNRGADLADCSVEAMRARAEEVLDAAYAGGIRWFDCARSYGLSEDFVGKWLEKRGHGRDAVAVSSKWGYRYTAGWRVDTGGEPHEVKDHSAAHLRQQWPESDALVGSHLRLYQVHSATFDSGILESAETHAALAALKRDKGWRSGWRSGCQSRRRPKAKSSTRPSRSR